MKLIMKVENVDKKKVVRVCFDYEYTEYVCKLYIDGKWQNDADYYTDDKEEAIQTASVMAGNTGE